MPVMVQFTSDGVGTVLLSQGVVTGPELTKAVRSVYDSGRFEKLKYWISDMSGRTEFLPTTEEINALVAQDKAESIRNPGMALLFVAPYKLEFGLSRMVQSGEAGNAYETRVFNNRAEADEWLRNSLGLIAEVC